MHRKSSIFSWRSSKSGYKLVGDLGNIKGNVESFTIVHNAPNGFGKNNPYMLALISLGNKNKIVSEVVDCKNVSIGSKVEPCLRKIYEHGKEGLIHYGVKFRVIK